MRKINFLYYLFAYVIGALVSIAVQPIKPGASLLMYLGFVLGIPFAILLIVIGAYFSWDRLKKPQFRETEKW